MNAHNHRIHSLLALLALLLLSPAVLAQVDTLEYLDEHYLFQWRDDSAAVCTHDGITCTRMEQRFYSEYYDGLYLDIPQEAFDDFYYGKEFAAGFVIDSTVKVVGFAVVTDTLPRRDCISTCASFAIVDTSAERWKENLRLYSASSGGLGLLKDTTVYYSAPFTRVKKYGYFFNDWDGNNTFGVMERYCSMYEYFFDTVITLEDSFYISFTRYTSVLKPDAYAQQDTMGNLMYAIFEMESIPV